MKIGTLLKYLYAPKFKNLSIKKKALYCILLEHVPPYPPSSEYIRVLWENGLVEERDWGYIGFSKEWDVLT